MDRPQYVNWIVREAGVVFEDQQPLNCYRLSYVRDDAILDDWALHIRKQYVPDGELEEDAALNKLTVEEYLRQYIIPQKGEPFGPTARSNDISEILFADLFEFILNYEVPRCKQHNRSGKNESEHGTDIIAYRFFAEGKVPHKNDELVAIEVKALLSSNEAGKVIKDAVTDSKKDEDPKFPLNSNELSYPVVYILSRYAESVIENNVADMEEFSPHLVAASQYFDAAVGANDRAEYDVDFLLSGAASYFLSDDFGSAKVLCSEYFARINPETNEPQKIMGNFLGYLLLNRDFHISEDTPDGEQVCRSLLAYYNTGEGAEEIQSLLSEYRKAIYENDAPMEIYYVDILCAIVMVALSKSSWILLPRYSELDQSLWSDYLKSPKAPRMLWPAQQLIGEKGVLRGQSAIVQLPTGVGKTKSIELVIRSSFASGRATTAIIVAPLRALCNEIANDMISAFGDKVLVNQFSDVLEEDFSEFDGTNCAIWNVYRGKCYRYRPSAVR